MLRSICLLIALALLSAAAPAVADTANSVTHKDAHAKLDSGSKHSCAVLGTAVRCWGEGDDGRLGLGTLIHGDLGDDEHPAVAAAVDLGATATAVTAGGTHACALLTGGSVRCWGDGSAGALGNALSDDVGDNDDPADKPVVSLGGTATAVSAGHAHTCALLTTGDVKCWGENGDGQLGSGDRTPKFVPGGAVSLPADATAIAAGGDHTCARLTTGALYCWGDGLFGTLGMGDENDRLVPTPVPTGGSVVAFDVGYNHGCAIMSTNALRCWGLGDNGALGYGSTTDIGDTEPASAGGDVNLGAGRTARSVTTSGFGTCAQLDNGQLRCWGDAGWGELGFGKHEAIGDDELPSQGPLTFAPSGLAFAATSAGGSFRCFGFDDASIRCAGLTDHGETAEPDDWTDGLLDFTHNALPTRRAIRFTGGGTDLRLRVSETGNPAPIAIGQERTFTLELTNAGPQATTGQAVSVYTPGAGLTVTKTTKTAGTFSNGGWQIPVAMQPGQTHTLTVTVKGKAVGTYDVESAIGSQTGPADVDSTPSVPSYGEDDSAKLPIVVVGGADVSVSTQIVSGELPAGGSRPMVVTVSNAGPDPTGGVKVDLVGQGWTFDQPSTWNVGTLASGQSKQLTVNAKTSTLGLRQIGAKVTASGEPDIDTADRESVTTVSVVEGADLMVQLDHPGYKLYPGDSGSLTLRTYNQGPGTVTPKIRLTPAAGLTVTGVTGTGVTWDAASRTATIGTLAPGQHTMKVAFGGVSVGDHQLTAEVLSSTKPDPDSTPGNGLGEDDAASVVLSVIARDVAPTKTAPSAAPPTSTAPRPTIGVPSTARTVLTRVAVTVKQRVARAHFRPSVGDSGSLTLERRTGRTWRKVRTWRSLAFAAKDITIRLGVLKKGTYRVTIAPLRGTRAVRTFRVK